MTTDILTDTEARNALGIGQTDATKSTLLDIAKTAVTQKIEARFGPVVYGTITAESHDGGGNKLYLDYRPVVQINSIVEYDGTTAATLTAESNSSKPTNAYNLNPKNGGVIRRDANSDALFPAGRDNVVVTYVAGRFATQGAITDIWKWAAVQTLKSGWRTFENAAAQLGEYEVPQASFPTFTIPKAVDELLAEERQNGSGTGD